jgi:hypothetical protein
VDFSLQMPGNAALFAVVCGLALHRSPASGVAEAERDQVERAIDDAERGSDPALRLVRGSRGRVRPRAERG